LRVKQSPPAVAGGGRSLSIKGVNLFGDDIKVWIGCLLEHSGEKQVRTEVLQDLVARHWSRGAKLLADLLHESGGRYEEFLRKLAAEAGLAVARAPAGRPAADQARNRDIGPVMVPIGEVSTDCSTGDKVCWHVNAPGRPPHAAIAGAAGTGKTRTAMCMLGDIYQLTGVPTLIFDMAKGDIADNAALVKAIDARVIRLPEEPVPIDVMFAPGTVDGIKQAAMRFRESFKRVPANRIGDAQGDVLREAAERALKKKRPTLLQSVHGELLAIYKEKKKRDDVVTATFNDMTAYKLFEPSMTPEEFASRSWVIDVHKLDEASQRLVVFLLLDAVYRHLAGLADAPTDKDSNRSLRQVICIDEARRVLAYEQQSLIGLIRESRSKGGVVMLMSQSPDDFHQGKENFFENIGLGAMFQSIAQPAAVAAMLGEKVDASSLPVGACAVNIAGVGRLRIQSWAPPHSA
jgi:hypothetical protein